MKFHTDLLKYINFIFFHFPDSGLSVLNGLNFYFWWPDSENSLREFLVQTNAFWSSITLYWTCMLCLDCQHFDLIVWIGSFTNLHMSSSWYLQTIGKELNRSFRQMFMGQECVTSPRERLRGRLKEHAVSKIIRKQEEKNKYYCSFWVDLLWKHHAETCEVVV